MRQPEEVKRDLVRQWLVKAEGDFGVATRLLSEEAPYLFAIAFHAQQAAEKYLKAFLTQHQVEFPKTHILGELLDLVSTVDRELAASLRDITALNPYGVEVRYPGDIPEPTTHEARRAVELAGKVGVAVKATLPT